MTYLELLAELIEDLARDLRPEIEPLTLDELNWNPGPQANSIGVTLWHIARGMDFLAVRVLQSKPADEEGWHTNGWTEKTGDDPRGIGYGGWGVVTGYAWEEVLAIPQLTSREITKDFEQSCSALSEGVRQLTDDSADQLVPQWMQGRLTKYEWINFFYKVLQAHVGEIMAIKAMKARMDKTALE